MKKLLFLLFIQISASTVFSMDKKENFEYWPSKKTIHVKSFYNADMKYLKSIAAIIDNSDYRGSISNTSLKDPLIIHNYIKVNIKGIEKEAEKKINWIVTETRKENIKLKTENIKLQKKLTYLGLGTLLFGGLCIFAGLYMSLPLISYQ